MPRWCPAGAPLVPMVVLMVPPMVVLMVVPMVVPMVPPMVSYTIPDGDTPLSVVYLTDT